MTVDEVSTFLAIVNKRNISGAAEQLFITQSATSQRLNSLEKSLGFVLFERKKGVKRLELTPQGEEFYPLAEQWLALHTEMYRLQETATTRALYVGGISSVNAPVLNRFYMRLIRGYYGPKFDLRIRTNWSNELYELLDNRKIDLAITAEKYAYKNLHHQPIYQEKFYIAMRENELFADRTTVHPSELPPSKEIFLDWSQAVDYWRKYWWPTEKKHQIHIDGFFGMEDFFYTENQWALVTKSVLRYLHRQGGFRFYNISDPPPPRDIYLVTHNRTSPAKRESVSDFESYLLFYLEELRKDVDQLLVQLGLEPDHNT